MEYNSPPSLPGGQQSPPLNHDDNGPENVEHSSSAYVSSVPRYTFQSSTSVAGGFEKWDLSDHPTFSDDPSQTSEAHQYPPAPSGDPHAFSPAYGSLPAHDFGDLSIDSSHLDPNVDLWSPSVFSTGGFSTTSLHQSYFWRRKEKAFFIPGRAFSCLWTATVGATTKKTNGDHFTDIPLGLKAYSDIQRFVVVRPNYAQHFSLCLPIKTYGFKGSGKFGVESHRQHAIIYTGDREPQPLEAEQQFTKIPIRMVQATLRDALRSQSRLNFARITAVDHNHYVKHIGDIAEGHLETLLNYYNEEHCVRLNTESATALYIKPLPGVEDVSSLYPATNTPAYASSELFTLSGGPRLSHGYNCSNEPTQPDLPLDQRGSGYGYPPSIPGEPGYGYSPSLPGGPGYGYLPSVPSGPAPMSVPPQDSSRTYETNRPPLSSSLKGKEAQKNWSQTTPESSRSVPRSNQRSEHPPRGSSVEEQSKKNKKPPRKK